MLYEIKWYVNDQLTQTKQEAYWSDEDLEERWNSFTYGVEDILRYEYRYIKDISLPENPFDFSNSIF